jgi:hypothetical protein
LALKFPQKSRRGNWASNHGGSARWGVRNYESLGPLRNEHCRNRKMAAARHPSEADECIDFLDRFFSHFVRLRACFLDIVLTELTTYVVSTVGDGR